MLQEEIERLKKELEFHPWDPKLRFRLSSLFFRMGELDKARKELQKAYKINPDDSDIERAYYCDSPFQLVESLFLSTWGKGIPGGDLVGFAFSSQTPQGVSLSSEGYLTLWNSRDLEPLRFIDGGRDLFLIGEGSPYFLTLTQRGEIHFRDYSSLRIQQRFPFQTEGIEKALYHSEEERLFLLRRGALEIWDLQGDLFCWTPKRSPSFPPALLGFALSSHSPYLATLDYRTVLLWDSELTNLLVSVPLPGELLSRIPTGGRVPLFLNHNSTRALAFLKKFFSIDFQKREFEPLDFAPGSFHQFLSSPQGETLLRLKGKELEWFELKNLSLTFKKSHTLSPLPSVKIEPPYGAVLKGEHLEIFHLTEKKNLFSEKMPFLQRHMEIGKKGVLFSHEKEEAFSLLLLEKFQWTTPYTLDYSPFSFHLTPEGDYILCLFEKDETPFIGIYNLKKKAFSYSALSKGIPSLPEFFLTPHLRAFPNKEARQVLLSSPLQPCSFLLERKGKKWTVKWASQNHFLGAFLPKNRLLLAGQKNLQILSLDGTPSPGPLELPVSLYLKDLRINPLFNKGVLAGDQYHPASANPHCLLLVDLEKQKISSPLRFLRPLQDLAFLDEKTLVVTDEAAKLFYLRLK